MNILEDIEKIIELHDKIIEETGGLKGIISMNLLEQALKRPFSGLADGTEFYPDNLDKAACLIESFIQFHPFVDGNKRIGLETLLLFLIEKGYKIKKLIKEEVVKFCCDIANKKKSFSEIKEWIGENIKI